MEYSSGGCSTYFKCNFARLTFFVESRNDVTSTCLNYVNLAFEWDYNLPLCCVYYFNTYMFSSSFL